MNWDQAEKNWPDLRSKVKQSWNKLTEYDLDEIKGHRDILIEKLETIYGYDAEAAERELLIFEEGQSGINFTEDGNPNTRFTAEGDAFSDKQS
jgi:uncharacterized protein YjbJ (UPF0337 family)